MSPGTPSAMSKREETQILSVCFRQKDTVVFRKVAGQHILVPIHKDAVDLEALFSFNETAARIWELIDGKTTGRKIAEIIRVEFGQSQSEVEADVAEFLGQLRDLHFIHETNRT